MRPLMPPITTPDNRFHDGNPITGELGTLLPSEHLNNEQDAIRDVQAELIAILTAAGKVPNSSAGQILAALKLLFAEKNDSLGALAGLVGAANKLPYFTGSKTATLADFTDIGRGIVAAATKSAVLEYLGLGDAAKRAVGTGANQIPDMSAFTTYGVANVFSAIDIASSKRIMEGSASGNFSNGLFTFTLPLAFRDAGFTFIPTDVGSGVFTLAATPAAANKVTMYAKDGPGNLANGTIYFKYMAMGSL